MYGMTRQATLAQQVMIGTACLLGQIYVRFHSRTLPTRAKPTSNFT